MSGSTCGCKSLTDPQPDCMWHGLASCKNCDEEVWDGGHAHYVSSLGHLSEYSIIPHYTCEK